MMTLDKDVLRADKDALIEELRLCGAVIRGNSVKCPFHDDRNPSGGIYRGKDGFYHYKCQTLSCGFYGDVYDVRAKRLGIDVPTLFKSEMMESSDRYRTPLGVERASKIYGSLDEIVTELKLKGEVQNIYRYQGGVDFQEKFVVIRYLQAGSNRKIFSQAVRVNNGWMRQGPPKPMPLYNLESVTRAKTVIVVEGEKCVEALRECGHVATTSAGGAGASAGSYWETLSGKTVYLWPDNDEPGIKHMNNVLGIFKTFEHPPMAYWINPEDLGLNEKGDVFDYLAGLGDIGIVEKKRAIDEVLKKADSTGPSSRVFQRFMQQLDGTRTAIHFKWKNLGSLTKALLPGTITMICGTPGSAKSFFLLENMMYWHSQDIRVAVMQLEEDQTYHLLRCVAMLRRNSDLLDPEWGENNRKRALDEWIEAEPFIEGFGDCIFESQNHMMNYNDLIAWVIKMIESKKRIIAVDPISALDTGDKNSWNEDKRFVLEVGNVLSKSDSSLILITHPRGGRYNETDLQNIQGGSAFARFTQTAIWIETLPEKKAYDVRVNREINRTVMANRIIKILKARNGKGSGLRIAYDFNNDVLGFDELGIIVPKDKKGRSDDD